MQGLHVIDPCERFGSCSLDLFSNRHVTGIQGFLGPPAAVLQIPLDVLSLSVNLSLNRVLLVAKESSLRQLNQEWNHPADQQNARDHDRQEITETPAVHLIDFGDDHKRIGGIQLLYLRSRQRM